MKQKRTSFPSKDEILQYWYDTDLETVCSLYHLNEEKVKELAGITLPIEQWCYNTVIPKELPKSYRKVLDILGAKYNTLRKVISNSDVIKISQTEEDLFHQAIINTAESEFSEISEKAVLDEFLIKFKTLIKYSNIRNINMKSKVIPLEVQNEEGEYFIPFENNAISKETSEG